MTNGDARKPAEASVGDDSEADAAPIEIDPRLDKLIGASLEAHYDDILKHPLPDKFIVLLAQLEAKERSS